jgi:two-component system cell cycle sensor histidine kinase/response regulator CckA
MVINPSMNLVLGDAVLLIVIGALCLILITPVVLKRCPGRLGRWARQHLQWGRDDARVESKPFDEHDADQIFYHLFMKAPVGIIIANLEGIIKFCNPLAHQLINDQVTPVLGQNLVQLTAADSQAALAQLVAQVQDQHKHQPLENRDGVAAEQLVELGPLEIRLQPLLPAKQAGDTKTTTPQTDRYASVFIGCLLDAGGQITGLIIHLIDITARKTLASQFAQSQKMQAVGQLAGGVAHDFNNLLTAMIGYCDLLLMKHKVGDPSFADVMQIKQNANRAANLVRQLLAFSRQQTLKPRVLNLVDTLAEIRHLLSRLLGEVVQLEVVHAQDQLLIKADQGQLEQVIVNLAVNARDAMPTGGKLTISTDLWSPTQPVHQGNEVVPVGRYVRIAVQDSGTGIPPEVLARIFEPFFTTKELGAGTGLGLSTVYGIVKQTGGYVLVESTVGVGTTFFILLPVYEGGLSDESQDDADSPAIVGSNPADRRILLVEDEDPVRLFSARALRSKGFTVIEARSGAAALEIIDKGGERFEVLVTDVMMPEMDGSTLIIEVRKRMPEIRVICISGYAEETIRDRLDQSPNVKFLPKPFGLQQLLAKVNEVLKEPDGGKAG